MIYAFQMLGTVHERGTRLRVPADVAGETVWVYAAIDSIMWKDGNQETLVVTFVNDVPDCDLTGVRLNVEKTNVDYIWFTNV